MDVANMAITVKDKKQKNNSILESARDFSNLSDKERALIYTIQWCTSDKSNKEKYTVDDILDVADKFFRFMK